jgi:hypothetical protein
LLPFISFDFLSDDKLSLEVIDVDVDVDNILVICVCVSVVSVVFMCV